MDIIIQLRIGYSRCQYIRSLNPLLLKWFNNRHWHFAWFYIQWFFFLSLLQDRQIKTSYCKILIHMCFFFFSLKISTIFVGFSVLLRSESFEITHPVLETHCVNTRPHACGCKLHKNCFPKCLVSFFLCDRDDYGTQELACDDIANTIEWNLLTRVW